MKCPLRAASRAAIRSCVPSRKTMRTSSRPCTRTVAIGALQRRAGDHGALAGGRRRGRSRRRSPAATASDPRRSADGRRSSSRHCSPDETCRHPRSASPVVQRDDRRWCSCPSRKRPSPPARKGFFTAHQNSPEARPGRPARPSRRVDRARLAGRFSPAKQARQDRALFGARNLEQHFAAGGERRQRQGDPRDERLDIRLGHADDPARGLVECGIIGKQRRGMAVGTDAHQHEIEQGPGSGRACPRRRTTAVPARKARRSGRDRQGRRSRSESDGCLPPARIGPGKPLAPCPCC